jgi:predicted nucleic acid-binding protein
VTVVVDSGPLIWLGAAGRLHLLWGVYGEPIIIAATVHHEVVVQGHEGPGAGEVAQAIRDGHIRIRSVRGRTGRARLRLLGLNDGEEETIAVAIESGADGVVIDEQRGYRAAGHFAALFRTWSTLDVLATAESSGIVDSALDELKRMTTIHPRYGLGTAARAAANVAYGWNL